MSDYVIMPRQDYEEACIKIREKTGKSDLITSGDMADEIDGIQVGGGESEEILKSLCTATKVDLKIPRGVTRIGDSAFKQNTTINKVIFNPDVISVGNQAFRDTKVTGAEFVEGLTTLRGYSFMNSSNIGGVINLPNSLTTVGDYEFYGCSKLTEVKIGSGLRTIGNNMFGYCVVLATCIIPNTITKIGNSAFTRTALGIVDIPDSVTEIGKSAFQTATITRVTIGSGVSTIGASAFNGCTNLELVDFRKATSVPTLSGTGAFTTGTALIKIVVPDSLYDLWIASTNWSEYASIIYKASEVTI